MGDSAPSQEWRLAHTIRVKASYKNPEWKGGRAVECIGFENRRSCETIGGSNPLLSEIKYNNIVTYILKGLFLVFVFTYNNTRELIVYHSICDDEIRSSTL